LSKSCGSRLTSGLDDWPDQIIFVEGRSNNRKTNHNGEVAGTSKARKNAILDKSGIVDGRDEPCVPQKSKTNALVLWIMNFGKLSYGREAI
jgi:hypothetical protein